MLLFFVEKCEYLLQCKRFSHIPKKNNSIFDQSRTNGPINAHLTIAQVYPGHNNENQEALL